jgi:hypothetical protein
MSEFEQQLLDAARKSVMRKIQDGNWFDLNYPDQRPKIRAEDLRDIFSRVKQLVLTRIEDRLADKIFNSLATELGNDTKGLMCDAGARASFRTVIRGKLALLEEVTP